MSMTGTAASATVTGATSLIVVLLGVEPGSIFWALMGSIVGLMFAPPTGRLYAALLFVAATMSCALGATIAAEHWVEGGANARNGCAFMLGASFHPILKYWVSNIPELLASVAARLKTFFSGGAK